jgi:hypothetical protein
MVTYKAFKPLSTSNPNINLSNDKKCFPGIYEYICFRSNLIWGTSRITGASWQTLYTCPAGYTFFLTSLNIGKDIAAAGVEGHISRYFDSQLLLSGTGVNIAFPIPMIFIEGQIINARGEGCLCGFVGYLIENSILNEIVKTL